MRTQHTAIALLAGLAVGMTVTATHAQVTRKPDAAPIRVDDRYVFDAQRWERLYARITQTTAARWSRIFIDKLVKSAERH